MTQYPEMVVLRMTHEMYRSLKKTADKRGQKMSETVRDAVEFYLLAQDRSRLEDMLIAAKALVKK